MFIVLLFTACKPTQVYTNKTWRFTTHKCVATQENDTLYLSLENGLKCPLRYYVNSTDKTFNQQLKNLQPVTLKNRVIQL